jgi:hypothetical protein
VYSCSTATFIDYFKCTNYHKFGIKHTWKISYDVITWRHMYQQDAPQQAFGYVYLDNKLLFVFIWHCFVDQGINDNITTTKPTSSDSFRRKDCSCRKC